MIATIKIVDDWERNGAEGDNTNKEGGCPRDTAAKYTVWPAVEGFDKTWSTRFADGEARFYKNATLTLQEHRDWMEEDEYSSDEAYKRIIGARPIGQDMN